MKMSAAKKARRDAVLRDVVRSGGRDRWSHLHSHGHIYAVVQGCVARGELSEPNYCTYEITDAGRAALAEEQ